MQSARLNILDELYLHLDRADEPFSVHMEVRVEGSLDPSRLRTAVAEAAGLHPIARSRMRDWRETDRRYHWEVGEHLADVPLDVSDDLDAERERVVSANPSLDEPPPFALSLVPDPGGHGDSLVMNLHHGAGDGMSAVRLMASILRAYAGLDDPAPPVHPLEVRDIGELVGAGSLGERISRGRALIEHVARFTTPPTRIAPEGGSDRPGYGFHTLGLEGEETAAVLALRRDGATANDVLLGALAVAIRRWNDEHDQGGGRIALMMPVNLRPEEWRYDVMGNFASYVTVHVGEDAQADVDAAIAAAAESTRRIKDDGIAGLIVDLLEFPTALPTGVKRRLQELIPLTGNMVVDTAVLSNLGKLDALPSLGDAGEVKEIWFSPPGRMPLGASFGAATMNGRLFLTLRYRHALFSEWAAAEFAALYRDILLGR